MKKQLYYIITLSTCWFLFFTTSCKNSTSNVSQKVKQESTKEIISKDLDTDSFKAHITDAKDPILIDVRTPQEVSEGYITGAKNIDFYNKTFMMKIEELDKNKAVYLYCRSGGRSGKAAEMLKEAGFVEVYNLLGGFNGWKAAGNDNLIPPQ